MLKQIFFTSIQTVGKALSHDFCPRANTYVYWLKQPVGWVVCGVAASTLVGFFVGPQGFVLAGAFLTLLILGVFWPWLCMKGLSCKLCFDASRSSEGKPTLVTLEVVNRFPIPAFGLMIQGQFLQDLNHQDDLIAVGLKRVPGWSVSSFQWTLRPNRRGQLPAQCPSLVTGFPFGLYQISMPVEVAGSTIVWPSCEEAEALTSTVGKQFAIDGHASRQAGNDGETIGVRDYRYGDSVRNIHWSQTARHNRLIIRERQSLTQTPVRIIVDLSPSHHWGEGSQSTYENAIRLAASVCNELHRHQSQIELICLGFAQDTESKSNNRRGIKSLLDFLALLPQFDNVSTPSNELRIPGGHGKSFTFLIHTSRLNPQIESSTVRCICVDGNKDTAGHWQNETDPITPLPVDMSAMTGSGGFHVST